MKIDYLTSISQMSGIEYQIEPIFMSDPERFIAWSTPPNEKYKTNYWAEYSENAEYTGLLFAGRTEFPWIVDVRLDGEDQETWAVGNIVSSNQVVTNCRAMRFYHEILESTNQIKVTFCTQYLMEKPTWGDLTVGVRWLDDVLLHPKCESEELLHDVAVLTLKSAILPAPPYIGYMPFAYDTNSMKISSVNLKYMNAQRIVCLVASFGKKYVNKKDHPVIDFKVKYRVYVDMWSLCSRRADVICQDHQTQCQHSVERGNPRLTCMRTRATVGTVCDHDRGAPVVCDGQVYGFVMLGAPYPRCNNLLPVPFVVVTIDHLQDFLFSYMTPPRGNKKSLSRAPSVLSCTHLVALLLSFILVL